MQTFVWKIRNKISPIFSHEIIRSFALFRTQRDSTCPWEAPTCFPSARHLTTRAHANTIPFHRAAACERASFFHVPKTRNCSCPDCSEDRVWLWLDLQEFYISLHFLWKQRLWWLWQRFWPIRIADCETGAPCLMCSGFHSTQLTLRGFI